MDPLFAVQELDTEGAKRANHIAGAFDNLLSDIRQQIEPTGREPTSREYSIVRTKLEEACFYAKKALANEHAQAATQRR
jgi:hypothetical protein